MAKRGRPTGHKLSIETKNKISQSKLGKRHTEATKKKISNAVRRQIEPAVSIERIMNTDLSTAYKAKKGKYIHVYIPSDGISPGKSMLLQVAVMEQHLGRKLRPGEQVHHWGSRDNNNINMLTLCRDKKHHNLLDRVKLKLKDRLTSNK